jgi:hypothetical protein
MDPSSTISYYPQNGLLIATEIPIGQGILATFSPLVDKTLLGYCAENSVHMYFMNETAKYIDIPDGIQIVFQNKKSESESETIPVEPWTNTKGETSFLLLFKNTYNVMWNNKHITTFYPSAENAGFDVTPISRDCT